MREEEVGMVGRGTKNKGNTYKKDHRVEGTTHSEVHYTVIQGDRGCMEIRHNGASSMGN